jgi:hypothetical protein
MRLKLNSLNVYHSEKCLDQLAVFEVTEQIMLFLNFCILQSPWSPSHPRFGLSVFFNIIIIHVSFPPTLAQIIRSVVTSKRQTIFYL